MTNKEKYNDLSYELWAIAQLMPNEGIEDGALRIEERLKKFDDKNKKKSLHVKFLYVDGQQISELNTLKNNPKQSPFIAFNQDKNIKNDDQNNI